MTKKERFLAALRRETPDVVPVSPLIHHRFAHKILGRWDWRAVFEVHQMLGSIHFRGPIGVGVRVDFPEGWGEEARLIEEKNGRKTYEYIMRTPKGCLTSKLVEGMIPSDPLTSKWVEYPVKEPEDWKIYQAFYEQWLSCAKEPYLDQVKEAFEVMGEEGVPSVGLGSVFSHLGQARGMQNLLTDLYDCPDLVKEVRAVLQKVADKHVEAFLESPAEVAWYDVCWATGSRMSPKFFEEWSLPEMQRVVELVRTKPGKYIGFYTLGKMRSILPMIVETAPDFIETFDPTEGDVSLKEAKEKYGDKICIMGNYDCVLLAYGTLEQNKQETLRCLREGMEGGGYILVTADEVPADAKLDNLKVMVETVENYGRY